MRMRSGWRSQNWRSWPVSTLAGGISARVLLRSDADRRGRAFPRRRARLGMRGETVLDETSRRHAFPSLEGMTYLNTAAEGIPPLVAGEALVAEMLGLTADEIGICSSSSEAFNLAAMALQLQPGDEVVINDLDFPAG